MHAFPKDHDSDRTKGPEARSVEPSLSGLLAIAVVRRLLLERGWAESPDGTTVAGIPLEAWVVRPLDVFGGLSPAQILARVDGLETVIAWLNERSERTPQSTDPTCS